MKNLKSILFMALSLTVLSSSAAPFCVAHRALGFGELENSYAAIEAAAKANAKAIEFDLLHTKDNETIVYHDDILDRLVKKDQNCPTGTKISNINASDLTHCKLDNGESVPSFSETMAMLKNYDSKLFIELKDKFTEKDLAIIMENFPNRAQDIIIISFNQSVLRKIKAQREIHEYLKEVKLVLVKKTSFRANTNGLDGLDSSLLSKKKIKQLKKQGKLAGVYTKNKTQSIKKAIKKGVDFITTNEYELCQSLIE
jgi:glycerophosphoryl diester phosphodiesterase